MYTSDIEQVKKLALFIINAIGDDKNRFIKNDEVDLDDVAAYVWDNYTFPFNEFLINDAIDLIGEAAESYDNC